MSLLAAFLVPLALFLVPFCGPVLCLFVALFVGLGPAAEAGVVDDLGAALEVEFLH